MYRKQTPTETTLEINQSTEGETIETKIERVVHNGEPIEEGAPLVYTERKEGVMAQYNPRSDRFEIAVDAMDQVSKSRIAKRESKIIEMPKTDDGVEPIQGTNE